MDSEEKKATVVDLWAVSIKKRKEPKNKFPDYFGNEDDDSNDDRDDCYCE